MKKKLIALITSALILCGTTACMPPFSPSLPTEREIAAAKEDPSLEYYSIVDQYDLLEMVDGRNNERL